MDSVKYNARDKIVTLYNTDLENRPLIVLNNYSGNGSTVVEAMNKLDCPKCNLLCVSNLNWDHDMTPWYCSPISKNDTPCIGGADEYLQILLDEILPKAKEKINGTPNHIGIAGYSLAGLFALYSMYKCDIFDRVASMSGSLWFPDFKNYCLTHEMIRQPDKIYLSLGDTEAKTRNPILKTVQDNTEIIVEHYKNLGIDVTWELNEGNHFKDAALRSAKGIMAILEDKY